jgi:hypothetical protein
MAGSMRLYPEVPARRTSTIVRDVLTVLLVVLFLWLGVRTYQAVDRLSVLGNAVADAGGSIRQGFGSVADAVSGVPLVGQQIANAITSAGSGTGGNLASLGEQGATSAHRLAILLGLLVGLLPTLVLLIAVLPGRIRQVRSLNAASVVLSDTADPAIRRVLASRAAFGLPYTVLLTHTRDPFGDLAAGRYDQLVAAALEDAGLRA